MYGFGQVFRCKWAYWGENLFFTVTIEIAHYEFYNQCFGSSIQSKWHQLSKDFLASRDSLVSMVFGNQGLAGCEELLGGIRDRHGRHTSP